MATTTTRPQTEPVEHDTQQSVYIADQDKVKLYPREMSNDEIDFDLHTIVRKNTPEDYYVNFLPLKEIQQGFNDLAFGGLLGKAKVAGQLADEAKAGIKYMATSDLEKRYDSWLTIWKESALGSKVTKVSDRIMVNYKEKQMESPEGVDPAKHGFVVGYNAANNLIPFTPWFLAEFAPVELLEFGTDPKAWVGAYGVEKFGPPLINKLFSRMPKEVRDSLLKERFIGEMHLKPEFEILGLRPNVKTTTVKKAYRDISKYAHPDKGGSDAEFRKITTAYEKIMKSRAGAMQDLFDRFRSSAYSKPKEKTRVQGFLSDESGYVRFPLEPKDIVKIGKDIGQVVKVTGEIALVNIAGKVVEKSISELTPHPKIGGGYSPLEEAVNTKLPNNATPEQILATLEGQGVPKEELQDMGLFDFLKGKETVTKKEIQDYLEGNYIQIQEVMKTGPEASVEASDDEATKFSQYQLPGGENYRELLLTLPENRVYRPELSFEEYFKQAPWGEKAGRRLSEATPEQLTEYKSLYEEWSKRNKVTYDTPGNFKSPHFDEPNVLAHIRFNERTDADGKKVLFIEEVQSDWHQKGRKEGYAKKYQVGDVVPTYGKILRINDFKDGTRSFFFPNGEVIPEKEVIRYAGAAPDAPFKKTWQELAMKRILRYAAENGYDKIAWTTGAQQAERYDLAKHFDEVRVRRISENNFEVEGRKDGKPILTQGGIGTDNLSEAVGKDLAEKAVTIKPGKTETYSGLDLKVGGEGMKGFYDQMLPSFMNKYTKKWGGRVGTTKIETETPFTENDVRITDPTMDETGRFSVGPEYYKNKKGPELVNVHSLEITPAMRKSISQKGQAVYGTQGKQSSESGAIDTSKKDREDYEPEKSAVNLSNMKLSDEARAGLTKASEVIKDELQSKTPISHEEVIEAAKSAEIINSSKSREQTLELQAKILRTRQHLAALAEKNEITQEFLDTLNDVSNLGTDIARNLEAFKIEAVPEYASVKISMVKELIKLGKTSDEILEAAKGVDFTNEMQVARFYRKFVKPKLSEILDEIVYRNILSSPLTHIKNTFSNVVQLLGLNPLTKLASGAVDQVASSLTGKARKHYISEVPEFYKGALNAFPDAMKLATDVMRGQRAIERPDLKKIPTLSPIVEFATLGIGKFVPRALEASDVFFRTMIEAGEVEALSKALGHEPDEKEIAQIKKEAAKRAERYVFRTPPDAQNATGQGRLLSEIDRLTNAIYKLREVPGFKWFIRFVQTPMNMLKQGIEYSPAGVATFPGAKDKTEQAGKAIIGSMVFAGAAWLAANNRTTWSAPKGEREKNEFYAAGLQPYSVRVGDVWVSYAQIGPLAYPIAMAAALHYFMEESPNALSDSEMDKIVDAMTGVLAFFSDQSYMQGIGDLLDFAEGRKSKAVASAPTQLVPLGSLQGWVNNVMDPIQRKAEKGLSIESVVDQIQMKVVGMSNFVPPQVDAYERPVKKQMREVNAVSPVKVSKVNRGKLSEYRQSQREKQEENKMRKEMS